MLEKKMLGDKTKGGFYKKQKSRKRKNASALIGRRSNIVLPSAPSFAALEMAKNVENTATA